MSIRRITSRAATSLCHRSHIAPLFIAAALLCLTAVGAQAQSTPTATATATPITGCCLCTNCPGSAGFCVDGRTGTECLVACIINLGCSAFVFGDGQACMMGDSCAGFAPPTATATPTETDTATPTETATDTETPTDTPTATETGTDTATPTETETGTPTETATATGTATDTGTVTETATETETATPTDTVTATATATETGTVTETATATATATATDTGTATATATNTGTVTSTVTNTVTLTPTNTRTTTVTVTNTGTVTNTPTVTNTRTATTTRTATSTRTETPTNTPMPPEITPVSPGATLIPGEGEPNCGNPPGIHICEIGGPGNTPASPPCQAPDIDLGSGPSGPTGMFLIPISPPLLANECIYAFDACNNLVGPVFCATLPAPVPALSNTMTIVAISVLALTALIGLVRLRRD